MSNQNDEILSLLRTLTSDMAELKSDVKQLKSWSSVTDNRIGNIENNMVNFATELTNLDEKVSNRLYNTQPLWQQVVERLDKIEAKQEKSDANLQDFRSEVLNRLNNLEKEFRVYRRQEQLQIVSIIGDVALVEERVEKIEAKLADKSS
jgi:ABC-type transporter Mla subunit MlaD